MTPERNETQKQLAIFPLGKDAVQEAVYWTNTFISSPRQRKSEMERLQGEQFDLFSLITGMGLIRNNIQFSDPKWQSHQNGALFMTNVLKNQYRNTGKIFPTISTDTAKTYFFDLLGADDNRYEINEIDKKNKTLSKTDTSLFPFSQELFRAIETPSGKRLKNSFINNSQNRRKELMNTEQYAAEVLKNGTFIKYYGPFEGLLYGAMDAYEVFKLHEEIKKFRRIWNKEIK